MATTPNVQIPTSRNRIIYNALNLYVGQVDPVTGDHTLNGNIKQLTRIQSFEEDFARNLTDINQYGQLAALDRIDLQAPTVKANYSYLLTDGQNEDYLGLDVQTGNGSLYSCISGILNNTTDVYNYFLTIADEGNDAVGYKGANTGVIGLGNCYVTNYSIEAAVGQLPKANVSLEALNINVIYPMEGNGLDQLPSVNPDNGVPVQKGFNLPTASGSSSKTQVAALQPGQMTLGISGVLGFSNSDLKIQNFKLNLPISRKPLMKLGSKFAFSRVIDFPVKATFSIDAEIGSLYAGGSPYNQSGYNLIATGATTSGAVTGNYLSGVIPWDLYVPENSQNINNLANVLCDTGAYNLQVAFQNPNCAGTGTNALLFQFNNCRLISQKVSTSIGSNAKLSAEWQTQLGGPQDTVNGVFISGSYPTL